MPDTNQGIEIMKYLDSTRSEKSKKLLKIFNILFRILFWVVIASEIIKYIMLVSQTDFTFGGFLLFIFTLILYTVVFAFGIWAFNIFWNAFIALVESAEHTIAHIQEMHRDGKFIQTNNDNLN